jgi:hypothetical protein
VEVNERQENGRMLEDMERVSKSKTGVFYEITSSPSLFDVSLYEFLISYYVKTKELETLRAML